MSTIRVLQVVGGMNRAGTETWLMHVLRHIDRRRFQLDFLVHDEGPWPYAEEIRQLGSRLLVCRCPERPWTYARNFRRVLSESGPFDVVHSHLHFFNGFVLRLAHKAGVPARIAHSHLDTRGEDAQQGLRRRCYLRVMKRWLHRHATLGLACSRYAAASLFGPDWQEDARYQLFYCGIDLTPFQPPLDGAAVRASLGLPPDAFVMGHVGRFWKQKNHAFLVEIAAEVARREPRARLLLVGDGPLRGAVERQVEASGLQQRVIFAGVRPDVPNLLRGAMDVFVMPSLYEGLPLVGMEAQAAGLPLVVSDTVTPEVEVLPELVHSLPLARSPAAWADAVLATRERLPAASRTEALTRMLRSPFTIRAGIEKLAQAYETEVQRARKPG